MSLSYSATAAQPTDTQTDAYEKAARGARAALKVFAIPELLEMVLAQVVEVDKPGTVIRARKAHSIFKSTIDSSVNIHRKMNNFSHEQQAVNTVLRPWPDHDPDDQGAGCLDTRTQPKMPRFVINSLDGIIDLYRSTTDIDVDYEMDYNCTNLFCYRVFPPGSSSRVTIRVRNNGKMSLWSTVELITVGANLGQLLELSRIIERIAQRRWKKIVQDYDAYSALLYGQDDQFLEPEWEDMVEMAALRQVVQRGPTIAWKRHRFGQKLLLSRSHVAEL